MFTFTCSHCAKLIEADDALAGCVVECTQCRRSVLAPPTDDLFWGAESNPPPSARAAQIKTMFLTLLCAALGAVFVGWLFYGIWWYFWLSWILPGIADPATAGWIGAAIGGFFSGLLTWRVTRE